MKLKEYQTKPILNELRIFSYQTKVNGQETTVNVELFPASMLDIANKIFLQKQGDLKADEIMEDYKDGTYTAQAVADVIKNFHVQKWKHWLEMWKAEYNPIWNVDGTETHTIVTQYGKVTTQEKDTQVETEYNSELETEYDSSSKTTYNSNDTVEQLTDGKYNTTHGHVVTMTEPTTTNQISAFDSVAFVNQSQTSVTQHSDTNSGTDQIAISDGKKKTDRGGYDEISRDGKDTNSHTGKDTIKNTGVDTDRNSGTDTVTDTLVRGGNIGVTMTQQLLTAEQSFWSQYSFFDMWFSDIAEELTLSIYE